jgi:hypothetical protein
MVELPNASLKTCQVFMGHIVTKQKILTPAGVRINSDRFKDGRCQPTHFSIR